MATRLVAMQNATSQGVEGREAEDPSAEARNEDGDAEESRGGETHPPERLVRYFEAFEDALAPGAIRENHAEIAEDQGDEGHGASLAFAEAPSKRPGIDARHD